MKIHELASALKKLANILESQENVELDQLNMRSQKKEKLNNKEIAVNVHTLAALSTLKRSEWIQFIYDSNIDLKINRRDSTRDIVGKLMKHLQDNPNAIKGIKNKAVTKDKQQSDLIQALDLLLKDTDESYE